MKISVIIPTCNRKQRLISLLGNLNGSSFPLHEVIIIDSSDQPLNLEEYNIYPNLFVQYIQSEKSVCIQRNKGINMATGDWIFLCDDDIEMPLEYLQKLSDHITTHAGAVAVSGLCLQLENNRWMATYPAQSPFALIWKFVFQQGIWGEIECESKNVLIKKIKKYYGVKQNHISKAGWPVLTQFSGSFFTTPLFSLGIALIKKESLMNSLYDEVLDRSGIGDNYGVAAGLPLIHVVTDAFVYHHRETINRLDRALQYYRRTLALDYFRRTKKIKGVYKGWLVWSLFGNVLWFILKKEKVMIRPAVKAFWQIVFNKNPYYSAFLKGEKIVEPVYK